MRFILILLIFLGLISALFIGQQLYSLDYKNGEIRDIYNLTNSLQWNYTYEDIESYYNITNGDIIPITNARLNNAINKFVDFLGYTVMEIMKLSIEFGYSHPEYNSEYIMRLIIYAIWVIIIVSLIPIIIPLLALLTILFMAIRNVIKKIINKK